jgi:hypothetical protein
MRTQSSNIESTTNTYLYRKQNLDCRLADTALRWLQHLPEGDILKSDEEAQCFTEGSNLGSPNTKQEHRIP